MTRRHFEAFAEHIRLAVWHNHHEQLHAAKLIADVAQRFNSRFDRERFYKACGL